MSSKLLSMKFMQRAASSPHSPSEVDGSGWRPTKFARLSDPSTNHLGLDTKTHCKRSATVEDRLKKNPEQNSTFPYDDSRWVLDIQDSTKPLRHPRIVQTDFSGVESNDETGRRSFGMAKGRQEGRVDSQEESKENDYTRPSRHPDGEENKEDKEGHIWSEEYMLFDRGQSSQSKVRRNSKGSVSLGKSQAISSGGGGGGVVKRKRTKHEDDRPKRHKY